MTETETREVTLTRLIDAPRELVFAAWTDPDQVVSWWPAPGMHTPRDSVEIDLRVGGSYVLCVTRDDNGFEWWVRNEIVELVEPELIVMRADAMPELGMAYETTMRIELHDEDGKTRMIVTDGPYTPDRAGAAEHGRGASLDRLADLLAARV